MSKQELITELTNKVKDRDYRATSQIFIRFENSHATQLDALFIADGKLMAEVASDCGFFSFDEPAEDLTTESLEYLNSIV